MYDLKQVQLCLRAVLRHTLEPAQITMIKTYISCGIKSSIITHTIMCVYFHNIYIHGLIFQRHLTLLNLQTVFLCVPVCVINCHWNMLIFIETSVILCHNQLIVALLIYVYINVYFLNVQNWTLWHWAWITATEVGKASGSHFLWFWEHLNQGPSLLAINSLLTRMQRCMMMPS